jgi:hypothetical protein
MTNKILQAGDLILVALVHTNWNSLRAGYHAPAQTLQATRKAAKQGKLKQPQAVLAYRFESFSEQ